MEIENDYFCTMIFLTGGTGLLGSHVLVELFKRHPEQKVRALKRPTSSLNNIKALFDFYFKAESNVLFNRISWVDGDILDIPKLTEVMLGCDEVYHCAGYVSFQKRDFQKLMKINREGTANMVNISLSLPIKKFCHVSSTAALGRQKMNTYYTENNKWVTSSENSNYAVSKYSAEMEVWRGIEEGLNAVIVNPSVILGAGNWDESSLEIFRTVKKGLKFYTPGTNAFVSANDVAFCMVELMTKNKFGERYLTIGENMAFKDLFNLIADELKVKQPSIAVKPWMTGLAWRLERLKSFFTGKPPQITRETAKSAMSTSRYSNEKVKTALDFEFTPIHDTVVEAVAFHNQ